ncbi:apolipoprotein N-acyltransferase [Pseudodesulfovibrio senegalensis]|uniref:Apolipoprotein N-acyltransferase n=1 Tax=Pseudodesulfovibrio senegalensis TaxID=1721087 RepID=A0A6N6N9N1_9BACT|nr:apolipoprotein N-acyltransferase [Pseudodesulfovibrio senegalensis]KAB1443769.1 apolipoprotein N-acyltransferase [Pseudodesulfovibrio senegalensis]
MSLFVLIAAVGAWLGFANPLVQIPFLALGLPVGLGWIAFRAHSLRRAFGWGWLAGTLACAGCMYWMVVPIAIYGNLPWFLALPCPVLVGAVLGLFYAAYPALLHIFAKYDNGLLLCLFAGLLWTSLEQLMGLVFTGFPWMNLASAFVPWPVFIQSASVVGAYGLSGLLVVVATCGLLYNTVKRALWMGSVLCAAIILFGVWSLSSPLQTGKNVGIGLVQGNVDQSLKWDPKYQMDTLTRYLRLSRDSVLKDRPELVVWPETAMPFYLQDQGALGDGVRTFAKKARTSILTGSPAYRMTNVAHHDYVLLNRAQLIGPDGGHAGGYDKEHLVPFGEYMPLEKYLPFEKLVQAAGNFVSGENNTPLFLNGKHFGVLICYEAIFPELAQKQVASGAQFLVNISNDAWFGKTSAPRQHLSLTTMRAVEQGRWIARCTNTGISAFIDPRGRIAATAPQFEATFLNGTVTALHETTLFHALYPWLFFGCPMAALVVFGCIVFFRRSKSATMEHTL